MFLQEITSVNIRIMISNATIAIKYSLQRYIFPPMRGELREGVGDHNTSH